MKAILILAHGSREKTTMETLRRVTEMAGEQLPGVILETAYMEFCEMSLEKGMNILVEKGADEIVVVPYFLFSGMHIKVDVPEEIKEYVIKHPGIKISMGNTLGADPRLADILADRIREVL